MIVELDFTQGLTDTQIFKAAEKLKQLKDILGDNLTIVLGPATPLPALPEGHALDPVTAAAVATDEL